MRPVASAMKNVPSTADVVAGAALMLFLHYFQLWAMIHNKGGCHACELSTQNLPSTCLFKATLLKLKIILCPYSFH